MAKKYGTRYPGNTIANSNYSFKSSSPPRAALRALRVPRGSSSDAFDQPAAAVAMVVTAARQQLRLPSAAPECDRHSQLPPHAAAVPSDVVCAGSGAPELLPEQHQYLLHCHCRQRQPSHPRRPPLRACGRCGCRRGSRSSRLPRMRSKPKNSGSLYTQNAVLECRRRIDHLRK